MNINQIYNEDCQEGIKHIPDASINCILTDPPYLYLKGQKLEREFNEQELFSDCKRVLKPDGFIVLFGRGTSFYRWNTMLANLGFHFKEEIVWDKSYSTSPLMAISRIHETISIYTKGKGVINRVKVPYLEMKGRDIDGIIADIKRMRVVLKNTKSLDAVLGYLENNVRDTSDMCLPNHSTISSPIIRNDYYDCDTVTKFQINRTSHTRTGDRAANVAQSITSGMNEKTIIKQPRDHYATIHPTQKPVRLLERLLALTTNRENVVLDPFAGSCSTAIACVNTNRKFIGFEIDKEYYDAGVKRLNEALSEPKLAM